MPRPCSLRCLPSIFNGSDQNYSCQQKQLQKLILYYLFVFNLLSKVLPKKPHLGACFLGSHYSCLLGNHLHLNWVCPLLLGLVCLRLFLKLAHHKYLIHIHTYTQIMKEIKHIQISQVNILKFGLWFFFNSDTICLCFIMELTHQVFER